MVWHIVSIFATNMGNFNEIYPSNKANQNFEYLPIFSILPQNTVVQPVFNPFSQFVRHLKLYSQLQLSLWRDPMISVSASEDPR